MCLMRHMTLTANLDKGANGHRCEVCNVDALPVPKHYISLPLRWAPHTTRVVVGQSNIHNTSHFYQFIPEGKLLKFSVI